MLECIELESKQSSYISIFNPISQFVAHHFYFDYNLIVNAIPATPLSPVLSLFLLPPCRRLHIEPLIVSPLSALQFYVCLTISNVGLLLHPSSTKVCVEAEIPHSNTKATLALVKDCQFPVPWTPTLTIDRQFLLSSPSNKLLPVNKSLPVPSLTNKASTRLLNVQCKVPIPPTIQTKRSPKPAPFQYYLMGLNDTSHVNELGEDKVK